MADWSGPQVWKLYPLTRSLPDTLEVVAGQRPCRPVELGGFSHFTILKDSVLGGMQPRGPLLGKGCDDPPNGLVLCAVHH
jgi:hypothetical protein